MGFNSFIHSDRFLYFYLPKYHHLFLGSQPNVFVNSIQKAGTHMLTNALAAGLPLKYNERGTYNHSLTRLWPESKKEKNTTPATVVEFLERQIWPGEIVRGHVEYDVQLADFLAQIKMTNILIVRHPLDVLLSLANWWERHNEIPVLPFSVFKSIEEKENRLFFLLTGQWAGQQIWPNLIDRYKAYTGWLEDSHCLVLRYEDFKLEATQIADKIASHLPLTLNKKKFLAALQHTNNRTFTTREEKVYSHLPENILAKYYALGGADMAATWGYVEKSHLETQMPPKRA